MSTNAGDDALLMAQISLRATMSLMAALGRRGKLSSADVERIFAETVSGCGSTNDGDLLAKHLRTQFDVVLKDAGRGESHVRAAARRAARKKNQ